MRIVTLESAGRMEKLCARDARGINFGHGPPLTERCDEAARGATTRRLTRAGQRKA